MKNKVIEAPLTNSSKRKLEEKINGFRLAKTDNLWKQFVVDFSVYKHIFISERGRSFSSLDDLDFDIEDLLNEIGKGIERGHLIALKEIIDLKYLYDLKLSITADLKEKIIYRTNEILVPETSAHGDLHIGNIIISPEGLPKLIDWEHYEAKSSYLFDVLHFCTREICNKYNCSWTEAIQNNELKNYSFLFSELRKYNLNLVDLKIGYILNRITLESKKKFKYLMYLPEGHTEKYNYVLKYLDNLL